MGHKVVIYGAGGHAKAIIDIIEKQATFEIVGLIDDKKPVQETVLGYKVLGTHEILGALRSQGIHLGFVAIGDNEVRAAKTELLVAAGFRMISPIHPFSSIGRDANIGHGSCVFHGVVIDPCTHIGKGVIVNKKALVGHDSRIDNFVHMAPGVNCGANVKIGKKTFVGIGATIISGISIGSHTIIGAGSVVVRNVEADVTVLGLPAKIVKKHK